MVSFGFSSKSQSSEALLFVSQSSATSALLSDAVGVGGGLAGREDGSCLRVWFLLGEVAGDFNLERCCLAK